MAINWQNKGYGLTVALQEAGCNVVLADGVAELRAGDEATAQAIIDNYSLDDAKEYIKGQIDEYASRQRQKFYDKFSPAEISAWQVKFQEAVAWQADNNVSAPLLSAEATARGVQMATLVAKVLTKAQAFREREAQISGQAGAKKDQVAALTTFSDVSRFMLVNGLTGV